jgi:hypothetical protein
MVDRTTEISDHLIHAGAGTGHEMGIAPDPRVASAPQRRRRLQALRELWWSHDRRRRIAHLGTLDLRHPLDEGCVADAMAHQIEEIRNLPEVESLA